VQKTVKLKNVFAEVRLGAVALHVGIGSAVADAYF
jgi:hypothetical protein